VPTIRVLVTFTKFEELQPLEEFGTPPSSPDKSKSPAVQPPSSSWIQWIKAPYYRQMNLSTAPGPSSRVEDIHHQDPFAIPSDYVWTTPEEKKKKTQENKNRSKKGRNG
jgi:ankyrin repeat domain-containing protein 13